MADATRIGRAGRIAAARRPRPKGYTPAVISSGRHVFRRFRPSAAALAAAVLALLGLAAAPLAADPPAPARDQMVPTAMSLIRFKRSGCDRIAGRVLDHWSKLGGSVEDQEERVRDYVLKSELSDLAASRAAADILAKLLPRVKSEVSGEAHGSMTRLDGAVTSLCDTVALPTGPLEAFRSKLSEILGKIDREETELGRLVVIPSSAALEAAIEPYLETIQLAGLAAESEYQQYLESLRPKARKATFNDLMRAWHTQVYLPAVTPSKAAWGKYLAARTKLDSRGMSAACRELSQALVPLLRDPSVFKSPEPKLEEPLRQIYVQLRVVAGHCTSGNAGQLNRAWADLDGKLKAASEALQRYGLQP